MKKLFFVLLFIFSCFKIFSQNEIELAQAYLSKGDVEKAYVLFQKATKKENLESFYEDYRYVLIKLKKENELLKLLKKLPEDDFKYRIDKASVIKIIKDEKASEKIFQNIIKEAKTNRFDTEKVNGIFSARNLHLYQLQLIIEYRKYNSEKFSFASEKAQIHYGLGQKREMLNEYLIFVDLKPEMMDYVQGQLQQKLSTKDHSLLEDVIYENLDKNNSYVYNELLSWHYIQQREFYKAFLEEKAIDNKRFLHGKQLMEFGETVYKNRKYDVAEKIFKYVSEKYATAYIAYKARTRMIESREQVIKAEFPIDTNKVNVLINDYESLYKTSQRINDQVDAKRNIARYKAYYLNDLSGARTILEELIKNRRIGAKRMALCKLDLADIYVFEENEWEAILLYGQVVKEAERVDVDLSHLAKLKTGRVYYYMSDFDLASEYLKILKMATSREIANDALDLAVLIQDNLGLDTSTFALSKYANAEKLLYQHKYEQCLYELDSLEEVLEPSHGMVDEIYWLRGKVYMETNDLENAKKSYLYIAERPKDIYTDDAIYNLAMMEEDNGNIGQAKAYYKQLMMSFPGSIYVAEARKKFRALRGDGLN